MMAEKNIQKQQRFLVWTIVFLCLGGNATAQVALPGNTRNLGLWLSGNERADSLRYELMSAFSSPDIIQSTGEILPNGINSLNFHPFPTIDLNQAKWIVGDSAAPIGSSVFMVIKTTVADEQVLWTLDVADTGRLVLTTKRSANLVNGMHLSQVPDGTNGARLVYHTHHADSKIAGPSYLRLGQAGPIPSLPVGNFTGAISEMLYYDRVVGQKEQSRISSYLAIKYGLTLTDEDYVASDNRRVWANRANAAFTHHVIAIARDSASALDQRQSTSSAEEGFLELGVDTITRWNYQNPGLIQYGHYLIAGDDGKSRSWKPREPSQPQLSERTWLIQRDGPSLFPTQLRLDPSLFLNEPLQDQTYWLLIDRSGTGTFASGATEFIPATRNPETVDFKGVFWDVDGSGKDQFRFAAGGTFIPVTWVEAPTCDPPSQGSLTVQVPGGEAPIFARLVGVDLDDSVEIQVSADTSTTIPLNAGEYDLTLSDNTGYAITDRIWVQPKDAPQIPLSEEYELTADEPLVLDATVFGSFITYEWKVDGTVVANTARLVVEQPGDYTCTAVVEGCPSRAQTKVFTKNPECGIELGVMPNPSLGGDFVVQVVLPEAIDATFTIASLQGKLVKQRTLRGQDFYRIEENIPDAGEYIISVRTADGQRSTRVIVL